MWGLTPQQSANHQCDVSNTMIPVQPVSSCWTGGEEVFSWCSCPAESSPMLIRWATCVVPLTASQSSSGSVIRETKPTAIWEGESAPCSLDQFLSPSVSFYPCCTPEAHDWETCTQAPVLLFVCPPPCWWTVDTRDDPPSCFLWETKAGLALGMHP